MSRYIFLSPTLFLLILLVTPVEKVQAQGNEATGIFTSEFFASDASGNLLTINTVTGDATIIGDTGAVMTDIAFSPSGELFGVTFTDLYRIDPKTAASALIGSLGLNGANALAFAPNGTLFLANANLTLLYTVNTTTGATTVVGDMGVLSSGDLAYDPVSGSLLLSASSSPNDNLYMVDLNTGASTLVGNIGFPAVFGIDFFSGSTLFGLTNSGALITINTTSGAGTFVANTGVAVVGAATVLVCQPELVALGTCYPVLREPAGMAPNLVVLVHGCCTDADDVRNEWESFGRLIARTIQTPGAWEIVVLDWTEDTPQHEYGLIAIFDPAEAIRLFLEDANTAYDNAASRGFLLWSAIAIQPQPYKYIHLIGHSAGAKLINETAKLLAAYFNQLENVERPFIHLTFLDAYTQTAQDSGEEPEEECEEAGEEECRRGYGYLADYPEHYAEHYVARDPLNLTSLPGTDALLRNAFNFDISRWGHDPSEGGFLGHSWPVNWYQQSVTFPPAGPLTPGFEYGFHLSLEGGNAEFRQLSTRFRPGESCSLLGEQSLCLGEPIGPIELSSNN